MEFFSSVEFYVMAIAVAILVVGVAGNSRTSKPRYSYIYAGVIGESQNSAEDETVLVTSLDTGKVVLRHHRVNVPTGVGVHLKVDVCGDEVLCVEKLSERMEPRAETSLCDVSFVLDCLKHVSYNVRYECEHNGRWCNLSFVNNGTSLVEKNLKL